MKLIELTKIELGEPWKLGDDKQGIAVPIIQKNPVDRNYILHTEIEGKVKLTDTGSISKLSIHNESDTTVFIRKGTLLKGGTQSRAVVHSLVVAPNSKTTGEIKCVYASKGIRSGASFTHSGYAPKAVMANLHYDQGTVWASVSSHTRGLSASYENIGATRAGGRSSSARSYDSLSANLKMDDLASHQEIMSDDVILEAMKNVPADMIGQVGVVILDLSGVQGIELFDHPDSWKALSKTVIRDYADILSKPTPEYFSFEMSKVKDFVMSFIEKLVGATASVVYEEYDAQTLTFEEDNILGEYSNLGGEMIHLYAVRHNKVTRPRPKMRRPMPRRFPPSPRIYGEPLLFTPIESDGLSNVISDDARAMFNDLTADTARFLVQKGGNKTMTALYEKPKTYTEVKAQTNLSPKAQSDALKRAERLGLVEKAFSYSGDKTVYQLTEVGKKVNPKRFVA